MRRSFADGGAGRGRAAGRKAGGTVESIASATVSDAGRPAGRNSIETLDPALPKVFWQVF
jgi:hypothetical protein